MIAGIGDADQLPQDASASAQQDEVHVEQGDGVLLAQRVERVERATAQLVSASVSFSGPMPPPAMLAGYEKVLPGAADRILSMAETEQKFRHEIKRTELRNGNDRARDGQRFGLGIGVLFLLVSAGLIGAGHPWPGTILGTVDIVALVTVFVTGKIASKSEEIERARILAEAVRDAEEDPHRSRE